jgi:hypothetical protein
MKKRRGLFPTEFHWGLSEKYTNRQKLLIVPERRKGLVKADRKKCHSDAGKVGS